MMKECNVLDFVALANSRKRL